MRSRATPQSPRARIERANALREALGVAAIDVLAGVRAALGAPKEDLTEHDYHAASRWFAAAGRGPSDAAMVWLEMRAAMERLAIARPELRPKRRRRNAKS